MEGNDRTRSPIDTLRVAGLVLLGIYTVCLLGLEAATSQWEVRNFLADIEGPRPLFGINTTLCAFLLWSCALLFAVCIVATPGADGTSRARRRFYWSQIPVFFYLAADDRFLLHEMIAEHLHIHDVVQFAVLGILELTLLLRLGNVLSWPRTRQAPLIAAACLTGVMVAIDVLLPNDMPMRLSVEDLTKAWACVFLFLFAWDSCGRAVRAPSAP